VSKLKEALAKVAEALGLSGVLLARVQHRYIANRKRAFKAHHQQVAAQESADRARAAGNEALAGKRDREALRHAHVAYANHLRAQHFVGVVKKLQQRINGLEADHAKLAAGLKKAHKVTVHANKIEGGTARGRLAVAIHTSAANCSTGTQHNYYSMTGAAPDLGHTLKGMPYGHRFDCSSYATGIYFLSGLKDPNGGEYAPTETMFTGTLGEHGKRVSESEAKTGDFVLYGPAPHHHVEVVDDPARKTTIGHGSAPIDQGVFDLFGDGDYEIRSYV
jgi:hypothetical protein